MTRAYELQEIVDAGLAPSVHYLQRHLRRGDIRGMKRGRHWVMTEEHVAEYVASRENRQEVSRIPRHDRPAGLSVASMRRRAS